MCVSRKCQEPGRQPKFTVQSYSLAWFRTRHIRCDQTRNTKYFNWRSETAPPGHHRTPLHNIQRNTLQMLLTQAVWFLQHTCVSSQHKRGAEKLPHKPVVERPSTRARVSQNPVSGVCNSERPCLPCDETQVCCKRQGTERHPRRRILICISPIHLQGLEEWLVSNAAPRRVL